MGKLLFLGYQKCSTSRKAQKWLDNRGIEYDWRDITVDNPSASELKAWHQLSGLPIRRLFNTSGVSYREQRVKNQLDAGMSDAQAYKLLATDGKMVKRPVLVAGDFVFFGFKEDEWAARLL
ncbi:MAG: arsenate reductase family protein [Raoultibacter sp.]|jgi:arsenate reductase